MLNDNNKKKTRLLVADDEEIFRVLLRRTLSDEGYQVETAEDGLHAIDLIKRIPFDVILSDIMMPRAGGIEVLKAAKKLDSGAMVILITGYASLDTALAAIKEGAYDYITKPFQLEEIKLTVANAMESRLLRSENKLLMEKLQAAYGKIKTLMDSRNRVTRTLEDIDDELERKQREIYNGVQALRNQTAIRTGEPAKAVEAQKEIGGQKQRGLAAGKFDRNLTLKDDIDTFKKQILET
jgi:CheY-like chemotaxis protein